MNYIVRLISNIIIYYLLLRYLGSKYEYKINKIYASIIYLISVILISLFNVYDIPIVNLLSSFFFYNMLSYSLFECHEIKEYLKDMIFYLVLVLADSLCFFITGLLYDGLGIKMKIFRTFAATILLIIISFYTNKIILHKKLKKIPYIEFIIFFIISFFSLFLILLFSVEYDQITNDFNEVFTTFIIIGIVFIDLAIIHYLDYINESYEVKSKLILEQKHADLLIQHYHDLKNSYDETRSLVHDFNNHFQIISTAYASGNEELAKKTISQFNFAYEKIKIKYNTGSEILDILLNEKYKLALKKDINFEFKCQLIDLSFIKDFDMITIFGNLLDNAIEANDYIYNGSKFINIKIYKVHEMIVINITNTCDNTISFDERKIISSKGINRGLGTLNIKKSVDKYDGDFSIEITNNICNATVVIPHTM